MNSKPLVAALLLAFAPLAVHAAADQRMIARYGLTEAQFRAANDENMGKGLRLADITVAEVNGARTLGGVWTVTQNEPKSTPERRKLLQSLVFFKLSGPELEAKIKAQADAKSQPDVIDAYNVGDKLFFAAVFSSPKESPLQTLVPFVTQDKIKGIRQDATDHKFDLIRCEVAMVGTDKYLFPSFVPREKTEIGAMDSADVKEVMAKKAEGEAAGRTPLSVSVYRAANGKPSYYVTFDADAGREILLDLPLPAFKAKMDPYVANGALVFDLDSYVDNGVVKYSAVLLKKAGG
jgi:hypothetical protein